MNSKLKNKALTKLLVYWKEAKNGRSIQTFYSLDNEKALENGNPVPGMNRLYEKLIKKYTGKFHRAIIYENRLDNSGPMLRWYDSDGGLN